MLTASKSIKQYGLFLFMQPIGKLMPPPLMEIKNGL
jgi:hypothetical protein